MQRYPALTPGPSGARSSSAKCEPAAMTANDATPGLLVNVSGVEETKGVERAF